jgi:hypothetical protein
VSEVSSWKPISLGLELQLNGASERGQEPLETEPEDGRLLEAAIKQRSEDRDTEHLSECSSDL